MKEERLEEIRKAHAFYLSLCDTIRLKDKQNQDPLTEQIQVVRIQNQQSTFVGDLLAHVDELQKKLDDVETWMGRFANDSEQYKQGVRDGAYSQRLYDVGFLGCSSVIEVNKWMEYLEQEPLVFTFPGVGVARAPADSELPGPPQAGSSS